MLQQNKPMGPASFSTAPMLNPMKGRRTSYLGDVATPPLGACQRTKKGWQRHQLHTGLREVIVFLFQSEMWEMIPASRRFNLSTPPVDQSTVTVEDRGKVGDNPIKDCIPKVLSKLSNLCLFSRFSELTYP